MDEIRESTNKSLVLRRWLARVARAHFMGENEKLVPVKPMLDCIDDWEKYLSRFQVENQLSNNMYTTPLIPGVALREIIIFI
ncbi:MAG: hypothetical protein GY763_05510 [Gammaproteobacteria bacterium]|nr:hypothetical protein [Gammaproteobacteria bacterium]